MMETEILVVVGIILALIATGNIVSFLRSKEIRQLLSQIAIKAPKDYFDPFGTKATGIIKYGKNSVSVDVTASSEGLYLESVLKFYSIIPWDRIMAIRVVMVSGKEYANLHIHHNGIIDRELIVAWNPKFRVHVPESVNYIVG